MVFVGGLSKSRGLNCFRKNGIFFISLTALEKYFADLILCYWDAKQKRLQKSQVEPGFQFRKWPPWPIVRSLVYNLAPFRDWLSQGVIIRLVQVSATQ